MLLFSNIPIFIKKNIYISEFIYLSAASFFVFVYMSLNPESSSLLLYLYLIAGILQTFFLLITLYLKEFNMYMHSLFKHVAIFNIMMIIFCIVASLIFGNKFVFIVLMFGTALPAFFLITIVNLQFFNKHDFEFLKDRMNEHLEYLTKIKHSDCDWVFYDKSKPDIYFSLYQNIIFSPFGIYIKDRYILYVWLYHYMDENNLNFNNLTEQDYQVIEMTNF